MKALYCDVDLGDPTFVDIKIENSLKALQEKVGGYIECVTIDNGLNVVICNEEGRFTPHNMECKIDDVGFVGKILIVGRGGDGEFCDYKERRTP